MKNLFEPTPDGKAWTITDYPPPKLEPPIGLWFPKTGEIVRFDSYTTQKWGEISEERKEAITRMMYEKQIKKWQEESEESDTKESV